MPELPEVETVRRGLAPVLEGAVISAVTLRRADLRFPLPPRFVARLAGKRARSLGRRGKYMIASLSSGESLVLHLGMTGRFSVVGAPQQPGAFYYAAPPDSAHDHVVFDLETPLGRRTVVYNDPRRFGFMDLVATDTIDTSSHFAAMGPEPLGDAFTDESLSAALAGRAAPIKAALLDQRVVAGLGNIYVSEALFRAGVSPRRKAASVAGRRSKRLRSAIVAVLEDAVAAGGSTLRDFAGADGASGAFQERFQVYDREGAPCPACAAPVRRIVQSGRSTFYCGGCQK